MSGRFFEASSPAHGRGSLAAHKVNLRDTQPIHRLDDHIVTGQRDAIAFLRDALQPLRDRSANRRRVRLAAGVAKALDQSVMLVTVDFRFGSAFSTCPPLPRRTRRLPSPTSSSRMSSIVARPALPPYSSMTMAMCIFLRRISSSTLSTLTFPASKSACAGADSYRIQNWVGHERGLAHYQVEDVLDVQHAIRCRFCRGRPGSASDAARQCGRAARAAAYRHPPRRTSTRGCMIATTEMSLKSNTRARSTSSLSEAARPRGGMHQHSSSSGGNGQNDARPPARTPATARHRCRRVHQDDDGSEDVVKDNRRARDDHSYVFGAATRIDFGASSPRTMCSIVTSAKA